MGAFISSRLANPEDQVVVAKDSWGWAVAVGVLALLVILAAVGLGYMEFQDLGKVIG